MSVAALDPQNTESSTEIKADVRSSSALKSARQNLKYLFDPNSPTAPRPSHFRTRALLRSFRFVTIFLFWRIVRYAKYALIGAAATALSATAFGGLMSGAAFVLAPPGIIASLGIGAVWMLGKYGFKKIGIGEKVVVERRKAQRAVTQDGSWRDVQGPQASPW